MIAEERTIDARPEQVWRVISDLPRWAERLPTVTTITARPGSMPPGEGSEYVLKQPGLPPLTYRVSTWRPGTGFEWVASSPGVRTIGTHEVLPASAGSLLRLGLRWEGPLAWAVRLLYGRRSSAFVRQEADAFARLARESLDM